MSFIKQLKRDLGKGGGYPEGSRRNQTAIDISPKSYYLDEPRKHSVVTSGMYSPVQPSLMMI
jgi:hypothetical protein